MLKNRRLADLSLSYEERLLKLHLLSASSGWLNAGLSGVSLKLDPMKSNFRNAPFRDELLNSYRAVEILNTILVFLIICFPSEKLATGSHPFKLKLDSIWLPVFHNLLQISSTYSDSIRAWTISDRCYCLLTGHVEWFFTAIKKWISIRNLAGIMWAQLPDGHPLTHRYHMPPERFYHTPLHWVRFTANA